MANKFSAIVGTNDLSNNDIFLDWCDHMEAHAIEYKKDIEEHGNPKALTAKQLKKRREDADEYWDTEVTGTSDSHGNSVARASVPELERLQKVAADRNAAEREARSAARSYECWYCRGAHHSSDCPDWCWYQSHPDQRGKWR
jgi:hypothetical protein